MGMIFNGELTLQILEKLNSRYVKSAKHGNKSDKDKIRNGQQSGDTTYQISSNIGIDLDTPSTPGNPNRWQLYLESLEPYYYSLQPNITFPQAILNALYNFLDDDNCEAIEFYAVEADTYDLKISQKPLNIKYFAYICVQSIALSQTTAHLRAVAGIPAKGRRKRGASPGVRAPGTRRRKTPDE
jgi:hypothetical protein